jgi:hypothetical protein
MEGGKMVDRSFRDFLFVFSWGGGGGGGKAVKQVSLGAEKAASIVEEVGAGRLGR